MTQTEIKSNAKARAAAVEERLSKKYRHFCVVSGQKCYKARDDEFFKITGLAWPNTNGVVLAEHAYNEHEARNGMFEDGDMFEIDEHTDEELYEALVKEIEE